MTRQEASQYLRDKLNYHGLTDWSVRLNQNPESKFLGLCSYKDKCIILSAHHIDIHPEPDVKNTILHEIAHALVGPGHAHNSVWSDKAKEIGCDNTLPCSNLSLSPEIIDAIRSGADVEVTFEEHVIRTPRYNVTRLQDKCEDCGKVAKQVSEYVIEGLEGKPDMKVISLECGHSIVRMIPKGTPFHLFQTFGDPNCTHEWNKNKCMKCNRFRLYDFQITGARFLESALSTSKGGAIFDEMGLGKTPQTGAYIYYHPEVWPVAWFVKSALKYQTASFIMNWLGEEHIPQIVNTSKDWLIPGLKHYIIGYDMLVHKSRTLKNGTVVNSGFDIKQFDRVGVKLVVLDECQQIKNVDSSRTQMVRRVVRDRKVIALSGTPWNNRGSELFPVLNMMDPVKFYSEAAFKSRWVDTYWSGKYQKEGGIRNIKAFREYTKDLCIRRERTEVLPELPLINRTKLNVIMTPQEEANYDAAVEEFVKWWESEQADMGAMAIIAAMAKMRHIVALAKISATEEYVDEFIEETDRKICIFAHHKDVQEILYNDMKEKYGKEIPVFQFVAGGDVNETQARFNMAPRAILVASQLAAGEGLNLQTCSDCVMHERQWNPGKEEQCEGRFIRIGSLATSVNSVYAHMEGLTAIDTQLDQIVERKRIQFHAVHNNGEAAKWNEDSIMKELADTIVSAHKRKKNQSKAS